VQNYIKKFNYQLSIINYFVPLQRYEDKQHHPEDFDATGPGSRDTLLDVSWRGLAAVVPRDGRGDRLDLDAAVVSFRHPSSDVQRLALAPDAGTGD
jgi:hypothetical protein